MNKFIIAFFGWILFTAFVFVYEKDKYDDLDKAFPVREWFNKNWDNMLVTFLGVCVLGILPLMGVTLEAEITDKFNSSFGTAYKWNDGFYLFGGFGFEFVYRLFKARRKKETV
jgi:hypothetical protein